MEGVRRITLECRGHGASQLGEVSAITIAQFARDAIALLDHLGVDRAVVGGISLGAAIALRLAALYPERAAGLILGPAQAWVDERGPADVENLPDVAELLAEYGPDEGARRLEALPRMREVEAVSPDNAASMRSFFTAGLGIHRGTAWPDPRARAGNHSRRDGVSRASNPGDRQWPGFCPFRRDRPDTQRHHSRLAIALDHVENGQPGTIRRGIQTGFAGVLEPMRRCS